MKRTLTLLLAVAMLVSLLAACGGTTTPTATVAPTKAPTNAPATAAPTAIPAEEIEDAIPTLPLDEAVHLTALVQRTDQLTTEYNDLIYWERIQDATNIFVNFDAYSAGEAVETAKSLMHASRAYPDFIMGSTSKNEEEKYGPAEKVFVPLNDYITPEVMPNFYNCLISDDSFMKQITATDGYIYGTARVWDLGYDTAGHIFIQKNYLDETGLPVPTTLAEFEEVLRAFKGLNKGIIPFELRYMDDTSGLPNLTGLWGQEDTANGLVLKGEEVIFSKITPEFRQMIEWVSRLYNEGLIDQESFAQDAAAYNAKINAGNVGALIGWRLVSYSYSYEGMENDYICVPPLVAVDGVKPVWRAETPGLITGHIVCTTANKNLLETMLWVDYQMDPFIGMQSRNGNIGVSQELDDNGKFYSTWNADDPATHDTYPGTNGVFFLTNDLIQKFYNYTPMLLDKYPYVDMYRPFHNEKSAILIDMGRLEAADVDTRARLKADIDRYVESTVIDMITGGVTDAKWDAFVNTLKNNLHLDEYIAIAQKAYDVFTAG